MQFLDQSAANQLYAAALELQWQLEVVSKLGTLFQQISAKFANDSICLCQAWLGLGEAAGQAASTPTTPAQDVTLYVEPNLLIMGDPWFQDLRNKSCEGPVGYRNSMPGKVFKTGAVQIIQNLKIIPPSLHPRSIITEEGLDRLAEALYIPVFDVSQPARGPFGVVEVLFSVKAPELMLVPDFISYVSTVLGMMQLSLSNPVPQPIKRSVLQGRRATRPVDSDADLVGSGNTVTAIQQQAVQERAMKGGAAGAINGPVTVAAAPQQHHAPQCAAGVAQPQGMQPQQQPVCSGVSSQAQQPPVPTSSMPAPAQPITGQLSSRGPDAEEVSAAPRRALPSHQPAPDADPLVPVTLPAALVASSSCCRISPTFGSKVSSRGDSYGQQQSLLGSGNDATLGVSEAAAGTGGRGVASCLRVELPSAGFTAPSASMLQPSPAVVTPAPGLSACTAECMGPAPVQVCQAPASPAATMQACKRPGSKRTSWASDCGPEHTAITAQQGQAAQEQHSVESPQAVGQQSDDEGVEGVEQSGGRPHKRTKRAGSLQRSKSMHSVHAAAAVMQAE